MVETRYLTKIMIGRLSILLRISSRNPVSDGNFDGLWAKILNLKFDSSKLELNLKAFISLLKHCGRVESSNFEDSSKSSDSCYFTCILL